MQPKRATVVAVAQGVPAGVVAVWSQSDAQTAPSDPVTWPLTSGDGGAPRGIRTPNRQIRSQPSPVPTRPPGPSASSLVLVSGYAAGPSRTAVPAHHAPHGRNVVADLGCRRQTGRLAPRRLLAALWWSTRSRSGALHRRRSTLVHWAQRPGPAEERTACIALAVPTSIVINPTFLALRLDSSGRGARCQSRLGGWRSRR